MIVFTELVISGRMVASRIAWLNAKMRGAAPQKWLIRDNRNNGEYEGDPRFGETYGEHVRFLSEDEALDYCHELNRRYRGNIYSVVPLFKRPDTK